MGAYECFMQTKFGGARHVTKILQVKSGQKVDDFEPIYLGNYDIDEKRFVISEHTINCLSFGYVRLPQPEYYFSSFFFFLLTFFFFIFSYSSPVIYF